MQFLLVSKHLARAGRSRCCAWVARAPTREYRTGPTTKSHDEPSKLTEEDYRYYLRKRIMPHTFEAGAHLKRLNPKALVGELPPSLAADPLRAFEDSSTSLATACNALELYVGRIHLDSQDSTPEKARLTYVGGKPGRRALLWLLSSETTEAIDMSVGWRLAQMMTHCLVAEKEIDILRTWICAPQNLHAEKESSHRHSLNVFNGLNIRGMMEALSFWTYKTDPLEDSFASFWYFRQRSRVEKDRYLSLAPAGNWLCQQLTTTAAEQTSAQSFDRFAEVLKVWKRDAGELRFDRARLALIHPVNPSALPALEFFSSCASADKAHLTPFVSALLDPQDRKVAYVLFWTSLRAAQMLERHGKIAEARFVLDYVHSRIPSLFNRSRPPHSLQFGPSQVAGYRKLPRLLERYWGDEVKHQ